MGGEKSLMDLPSWDRSSELDINFVCDQCMRDKYLRHLIKSNLESSECSYCQRKSKKLIAAPLSDLMGSIFDGIKSEWEHPEDILGYNSAEGGWVGADVYDTYDLSDYIADEAGITNIGLLEGIVEELIDYQWCKHPADTDFSEDMNISWDNFSSLIKHKYRYTFSQIDEKVYSNFYSGEGRISPHEFLDELNVVVKKSKKIIKCIPKGTQVFRVRLFDDEACILETAKGLGAPPAGLAKANRMSPAGIPLFYGAQNADTALAELLPRKAGHKCAVVAKFETTLDLEILDLCNIPDLGSLFDPKKRHLRKMTIFLSEFSRKIKMEIKLEDQQIDYVPTQALTEYFRYIYKHKKSKSLGGIFYGSSQVTGGINCALFVNNAQCVERGDDQKDAILVLIDTIVRAI